MAQAFTPAELKGSPAPRFSEARSIRFQDVDAAGIVFYPRVLEYFHDAYVGWLDAGGYDVRRTLDEGRVVLPLVHAEADYLGPLRFGDRVTVEIVAARTGESSYSLGYRVRLEDGRLAAIGQTAHVCVDRATFRACAIPPELRAVLEGAG